MDGSVSCQQTIGHDRGHVGIMGPYPGENTSWNCGRQDRRRLAGAASQTGTVHCAGAHAKVGIAVESALILATFFLAVMSIGGGVVARWVARMFLANGHSTSLA